MTKKTPTLSDLDYKTATPAQITQAIMASTATPTQMAKMGTDSLQNASFYQNARAFSALLQQGARFDDDDQVAQILYQANYDIVSETLAYELADKTLNLSDDFLNFAINTVDNNRDNVNKLIEKVYFQGYIPQKSPTFKGKSSKGIKCPALNAPTQKLLCLDYKMATPADVFMLIQKGADVNAKKTYALAQAIDAKNEKVVNTLLAFGADCDIMTPLPHNMILKAVKSKNIHILTDVLAYTMPMIHLFHKESSNFIPCIQQAGRLNFGVGVDLLQHVYFDDFIPSKQKVNIIIKPQKIKMISTIKNKKGVYTHE